MENTEKSHDKPEKVSLIQDLKQQCQAMSSPEFFTNIGVDKVVFDPLTMSGKLITEEQVKYVREGGVLGQQKEDLKDQSASGSARRLCPSIWASRRADRY